jgi:hypothetical protein
MRSRRLANQPQEILGNCEGKFLDRVLHVIFSPGVVHFYQVLDFNALKINVLQLAKALQLLARGGDEPRIPLGD